MEIAPIEEIALSIIALTIGAELHYKFLKKVGSKIMIITAVQALGAFFMVIFATRLFGGNLQLALLLGALATATAPAATLAVIREYKAKGNFTNTLLAVVALDDVMCVVIFSFAVAFAKMLNSVDAFSASSLIQPLEEVGFSLGLGVIAGLLVSLLVKKLNDKEALVSVLGVTFLVSGLSRFYHLSPLLTAMTLGATIGNIYSRRRVLFDQMENLETPIYVVFFLFAGTQLELGAVTNLGVIGLAYVFARTFGKIGGAYLGALGTRSPEPVRKYLGLGLIPQAGVAIGLALIAGEKFPALRTTILTIILASVVIYEILGPLAAKIAISKAGEITVEPKSGTQPGFQLSPNEATE